LTYLDEVVPTGVGQNRALFDVLTFPTLTMHCPLLRYLQLTAKLSNPFKIPYKSGFVNSSVDITRYHFLCYDETSFLSRKSRMN
jgi:hypothetical protein